MADLVDYGLIQAYQSATAPRQRAISGLTQTLGDAVGDVGAGLVGRAMDVKGKRAEIEAYQKALSREQATLESERKRLMEMADTGPFEKADRDVQIANIDSRIGQIQQVANELPPIGESVNFRNVYRTDLPEVGPARTRQPGARFKDIEHGIQQTRAQQQAEAQAKKDAEERARFERKFEQDERRINADTERRQTEAERKEAEDQRKFALLPPSLESDVRKADELLDSIDQSMRMIEENKQYIPLATKAAMRANQARREGTWTGDIKAWWAEVGSKDTADTEQERKAVNALLNAIEQVAAPIRSKTFGAVLTAQEEAKAENNLPVAGDEESDLLRKLGVLRELYQASRDKALAKGKKAGYNLEAYQREEKSTTTPPPLLARPDAPALDDLLATGEWEIVE